MTLDQQEPSANSPCTKTTFFVFSDVWALATRLSTGKAATAAAAPINVRRFIIDELSWLVAGADNRAHRWYDQGSVLIGGRAIEWNVHLGERHERHCRDGKSQNEQGCY